MSKTLSTLTAATTPLDGTEELYVVQGGNSRMATSAAFYIPGGTDVAVVDGGTGASTASGARTNLGLVIGTDVQAYDADLAAWAGVNPSSYSTTADIAAAYQPLDSDLTSWAGVTRASGFDTFAAGPSSANLKALLTDETGSGAAVFATSPTLVTPALGTPSALVLTNATGLPFGGANFTIDEDDMASDSATKVPTQQSVKAYVDSAVGISVAWYGAAPGNTASVNTLAIQAAINFAYARGGGTVRLPFVGDGVYDVTASAETDSILQIHGDHTSSGRDVSEAWCLVLRSGVMLELDQNVTILGDNLSNTIIGMLSMTDGGGIRGGRVLGQGATDSGTGTNAMGIETIVLASEDPNVVVHAGIVIEDLEVGNVASYGIGMQYGYYKNCRFENIYIHDTGQDCFDFKARPLLDGTVTRGASFDNILAERPGRVFTGGVCGLDLRGNVQASNIHVHDIAVSGSPNVGIRFDPGTYLGVDIRDPSIGASLTNAYIDGGDPSIAGITGFVFLGATSGMVTNVYVTNCDVGVSNIATASGFPSVPSYARIANIIVEGARTQAFQSAGDYVSWSNCMSLGQNNTFESKRGNLAAAQTVFTLPRPFATGSFQLYKNGTLLTGGGTDYTVNSTTQFTMTSGVLGADVLVAVTPNALGWQISGLNNSIVGCQSLYTTLSRNVSAGAAVDSLTLIGNNFEGVGSVRAYNNGNGLIEPFGSATNIELELWSKGTSGVTMRSRSARALRAVNPASAVNWLEIQGSATGNRVRLLGSGSDTNVGIELTPKGSGVVAIPIASVGNYADDTAAATGGVAVGGLYRTASALKIRVT